MQLNQAFFLLGGGSGYVPQPDVMRDDIFDPFDKDTVNVEPITIQLQVPSDWRLQTLPENCQYGTRTTLVFICCSANFRCWEPVTCPETAAASSVPSWRWRSVGQIMTPASTGQTL